MKRKFAMVLCGGILTLIGGVLMVLAEPATGTEKTAEAAYWQFYLSSSGSYCEGCCSPGSYCCDLDSECKIHLRT